MFILSAIVTTGTDRTCASAEVPLVKMGLEIKFLARVVINY